MALAELFGALKVGMSLIPPTNGSHKKSLFNKFYNQINEIMKPKQLFILLLSAITICSCNSSNENVTEIKDSTSVNFKDANLEKSEIIEPFADSAAIIATRTWELGDMENEWKNAKSTSYTSTISFDHVKASVLVKFTTLTKDSNNNIFKDVTVSILQPNKDYSLSASISEQLNMGTRQAFDTYVMVEAQAVLKPGSRSTRKLEGKSIVIYAKAGKTEPF